MSPGEGDKWFDIDDAALADAASKNDERAFAELLRRHRTHVLAICLRMMGNRAEAEEAAQDSFVKAYLHLKDFQPGANFGAWVTSICLNECRDRLRKRTRSSRLFPDVEKADSPWQPGAEDEADVYREKLSAAEAAIEQLPPKLKEVLVLKVYGDHPYEEIASILRIRMGTVMSRLYRARQRLTKILSSKGIPLV